MRPIGNYGQLPEGLPVVKWQGGELLAWRVWRLCRSQPDGGLRLVSLVRDTVWHGPVVTADLVPAAIPSSGSGVYALKPATRPGRPQFDWALGPDTWVRGWIALSGQVVEHERGYRAERVVIRRLRLGVAAHRHFRTPKRLAQARDDLERRYQCPMKITGVDARIARSFASPVSLPTIASVQGGWAPAPTAPAPRRIPVVAFRIGPKIYRRAVRRLREQIAGWRAKGNLVVILKRPYYAGLRNVRSVLRINGMHVRVFFHAKLDRWRTA